MTFLAPTSGPETKAPPGQKNQVPMSHKGFFPKRVLVYVFLRDKFSITVFLDGNLKFSRNK